MVGHTRLSLSVCMCVCVCKGIHLYQVSVLVCLTVESSLYIGCRVTVAFAAELRICRARCTLLRRASFPPLPNLT